MYDVNSILNRMYDVNSILNRMYDVNSLLKPFDVFFRFIKEADPVLQKRLHTLVDVGLLKIER